jgi:glycosyltransferase involved in cell wall biosynthesis
MTAANHAHKKFLLAQQAPIEGYPPVLNQIQLLAALGDLAVLDLSAASSAYEPSTPTHVRRIRISARQTGGRLRRLAHNAAARTSFALRLIRECTRAPDVAIAYDVDAVNLTLSPLVRRLLGGSIKIAHLHEITEPADHWTPRQHVAVRTLHRRLCHADLVIVPDWHRGQILARQARLPREPHVVMNCPVRVELLPESKLLPWVNSHGLPTHRIVQYQGSVGEHHGLEATLRSMPLWPADSVFAIVGDGPSSFAERLKALATHLGVADRVLFAGRVRYADVLSFAVGARVGVSMLEGADGAIPNWWWSAGASNKRFEYMATGVPQITNNGPGIQQVFVKAGAAVTADPLDPGAIARAVVTLMTNDEQWSVASVSGRRAHLEVYNYEHQLQPVLEWLIGR